ncbi:MAG: hypothetical protein HY897_13855, partial [Deltaproteobacteria bacterium]|nr:hypothetical protein [Deltaproteobacteria bacterium]
VTGGASIAVTAKLTAVNPLVLTAPVASKPVGFGAAAQFDITVSGGTEPYTYAWSVKTAPTTVTLSDAAAKNPTFTTGTLADVLAGGKVTGLTGLERKGFVPVSANQLTQMSYVYNVKVTDAAGFTKTVAVTVPTATLAQGNGIVPRNQIVIVSVPGNATALTLAAPPGSAAVLNEASTATPWFAPDVAGDYTVDTVKVNAGDFISANPSCGVCHSGAVKDNVDAKFKAWANSAHGNHFFKYMEYDANGVLVWKSGDDGKPIPAPTGDENIFWDQPGAMTTFQFGMTGAEGSHYSANCLGCHTTGYNLLAENGGMDDAMKTAGWAFPDLKAAFGGDDVTAAPVTTVWDAIPADVKKYAGMQCESCHGPLGNHAGSPATVKPQAEYDAANCAVCHDKPSSHDRVALWKQSLHAELELAEEEASAEMRGTSTSCYRCHGAQGYVQYLKNKETNPDGIDRPASLDQTGFSACAPAAGNRDYNQPLDANCACRLSSATTTPDTPCATDADCASPAGVCVTTGLDSAGTAFKKICVKTTCTPKAITCTPAVGHRLSGEDLDPACPSRSFTAISIPFTGCADDAACTAVAAGSICISGQCVWPQVAADPAFYTYLAGLGLNKEEVQPLSCAACHDPHKTDLRVHGNTGKLGNGAEANGAGAGATCMVCHNTRNGARGDFVSSSSIGGPHAPVQTDLFLGVNAYFMGAGGNLSAHAVIENTCVGCHVEKAPYGVTVKNTNHTFEADATICLNCHEDASYEMLEGQFMVSRGNLEKAFGTAVAAALNTGSATTPIYNYYVMAINPATAGTGCATTCAFDEVCDGTEATPTCEKKVKLVNLIKAPTSIVPSGRTANLAMTFSVDIANPFGTPANVRTITANFRNISSSNVLKLDGLNLSSPKFSSTGIIAKANWNYWLVSSVTANPAANVVHNPQFVFDVLNATTSKLLGAGGAGL